MSPLAQPGSIFYTLIQFTSGLILLKGVLFKDLVLIFRVIMLLESSSLMHRKVYA